MDKHQTQAAREASWLARYEQFLLKNSSQISSIESSIRSLSFILPGRFKDVEVASEALTSVLQILGLYHDSILARAARRMTEGDPEFKPSLHTKYTEHAFKHKTVYKYLALLVTLTQYTELLWETVAAKRGGDKSRWRVILGIESLKASIRLALLAAMKRPMTSPLLPQRQFDPEDPRLQNRPKQWVMPRTGKPLPQTPLDSQAYLLTNLLSSEDVSEPLDLLHKLESLKGTSSEVLYILRPLIYAMLAFKFRKSPRNWTPWVAGFVIEFYSRRLLIESYSETIGLRNVTQLEADELKKRGAALWWWSLRGAMYQKTVRPVLNTVVARTANIPVINLFGGILDDYMYLLDTYHFSSSSL